MFFFNESDCAKADDDTIIAAYRKNNFFIVLAFNILTFIKFNCFTNVVNHFQVNIT